MHLFLWPENIKSVFHSFRTVCTTASFTCVNCVCPMCSNVRLYFKKLSTSFIFYHILWQKTNNYDKIKKEKLNCLFFMPKKQTRIKFSWGLWFLFYTLIFSFLLYNSFNSLDPDLGWHLKVGQEIIVNKTIPHIEHYDYPIWGQRWVDHEWLINAVSYYIYTKSGYIALNIFFALLIIIALVILTLWTKKYFAPKSDGLIAFFQILGLWAITPHLGVRMQEITLFNLLLLLIIVYFYEKKKDYKILFALPPLFCFWANVHGGFLIGIFLLFFWLDIKISEKIINRTKIARFFNIDQKITWKNLLIFALFSFLAVAATLINAYGMELYSFLSDYRNNFYMIHIAEWLPAFFYPINYVKLIYTSFLVAIFIINLITNFSQKKQKITLWSTSLIFLFFFLSFKARRHYPLFFIASFPYLIKSTAQLLGWPLENFSWLKNNLMVRFYAVAGLVLATIILFLQTNWTNTPFTNPKFCQSYPCQAVEFLKSHPEYSRLKIFNRYGWGGFLIWVWPEKKLFIDGRLPQYRLGEHTFLEEYYDFFDKEKSQEKLNQYDIGLILLPTEKPPKLNWFDKYVLGFQLNKFKYHFNNLKELLNKSSKWSLVYQDNIALVYIKK